jgi:hypothetical protein
MELRLEVPTESEMYDLINNQKTDFMTTFAKKKNQKSGGSSGSGSVGLMSRDKLKNKHYTPSTGIKNAPPSKPAAVKKPKKQAHSVMVDVDEISNGAIEAVDKAEAKASSGEKKRLGIQSKYQQAKYKPTSARGYKAKLSPNKVTPNPGDSGRSKDSSANQKSTKSSAGGVAAQRPRSNYQPKRNYNKPWQRPQTAGTRPE